MRDSGRGLINSFLWLSPALITRLIFPQPIINFIKFICQPGACPFSCPVLSKIIDCTASAGPLRASTWSVGWWRTPEGICSADPGGRVRWQDGAHYQETPQNRAALPYTWKGFPKVNQAPPLGNVGIRLCSGQ